MSHLFVLPTDDAQSSSSPTSSAELMLTPLYEMKAIPNQQRAPSVPSYLHAPSLTKHPHPDNYDYFDDVNHRLSRPTAYNQNNDDADSTAAPPSAPTRDALGRGGGVGVGGSGVFNPYPQYQQRQDHYQGHGHGYNSYLFNNGSYPKSSPPPGLVAAWSSPDNSSRTSTSRSYTYYSADESPSPATASRGRSTGNSNGSAAASRTSLKWKTSIGDFGPTSSRLGSRRPIPEESTPSGTTKRPQSIHQYQQNQNRPAYNPMTSASTVASGASTTWKSATSSLTSMDNLSYEKWEMISVGDSQPPDTHSSHHIRTIADAAAGDAGSGNGTGINKEGGIPNSQNTSQSPQPAITQTAALPPPATTATTATPVTQLVPCSMKCGFYGSVETNYLCSQCLMKTLEEQDIRGNFSNTGNYASPPPSDESRPETCFESDTSFKYPAAVEAAPMNTAHGSSDCRMPMSNFSPAGFGINRGSHIVVPPLGVTASSSSSEDGEDADEWDGKPHAVGSSKTCKKKGLKYKKTTKVGKQNPSSEAIQTPHQEPPSGDVHEVGEPGFVKENDLVALDQSQQRTLHKMAVHEVDEQECKGGQLEDDRYDDDLFSYNLRILNNDGVDDGITTCSSMWDGYSTHSAVVQEARERSQELEQQRQSRLLHESQPLLVQAQHAHHQQIEDDDHHSTFTSLWGSEADASSIVADAAAAIGSSYGDGKEEDIHHEEEMPRYGNHEGTTFLEDELVMLEGYHQQQVQQEFYPQDEYVLGPEDEESYSNYFQNSESRNVLHGDAGDPVGVHSNKLLMDEYQRLVMGYEGEMGNEEQQRQSQLDAAIAAALSDCYISADNNGGGGNSASAKPQLRRMDSDISTVVNGCHGRNKGCLLGTKRMIRRAFKKAIGGNK